MDQGTLLTLLAVAVSAGVVGGLLAGLLGVGGGIVIVPALYFALSFIDLEPGLVMQLSVGTSLMTIIFTSLSSASGHYKRGAVDFALLKLWAPSILVGVLVGSITGGLIDGRVMIGVFAVVAAIVALNMVFSKHKQEAEPRSFAKPVWAGFGVFAGAVSAMMGIGGGTACVPLLNILGYDIRKAVGTSAAIGLVIGLPATIVYIVTGWGVEGLPPFSLGYVNLLAAAIITSLTVFMARVGVAIAHAIPQRALQLAFGLFLGLTAIRMTRDLILSMG